MSPMRRLLPNLRVYLPLLIFVFILFTMGALFGVLLVPALSIDQNQALSRFIGSFLQLAVQGKTADIQGSFWNEVVVHAKWIGITWFLGISVIGMPLVMLLAFLKGMLLGFTVCFLTTQLSWKGFLLSLGALLPGNVVMIPALLISCTAAISFAAWLVKSRMNRIQVPIRKRFWLFTAVIATMLLLVPLVALIEVYVVPYLLKWMAPFVV